MLKKLNSVKLNIYIWVPKFKQHFPRLQVYIKINLICLMLCYVMLFLVVTLLRCI